MTENFKNLRFIIDSSAWIEYFNGTEKGKNALKIIEKKENEIMTLDVCAAEIKFWALNQKKDFRQMQVIIRANSSVIETNSEDWLKAAEIKFEKRKEKKNFGFVDALIIVKSFDLKAGIVTTDQHFKNEKHSILL